MRMPLKQAPVSQHISQKHDDGHLSCYTCRVLMLMSQHQHTNRSMLHQQLDTQDRCLRRQSSSNFLSSTSSWRSTVSLSSTTQTYIDHADLGTHTLSLFLFLKKDHHPLVLQTQADCFSGACVLMSWRVQSKVSVGFRVVYDWTWFGSCCQCIFCCEEGHTHHC